MHTIHPDAEKVLRDIHADIWNLCNNHIMDAGQDGLALTLQEAKKSGTIQYEKYLRAIQALAFVADRL